METTVRTITFTGPSGYEYTIREQNGADDDVLSNMFDVKNSDNISKFIMGLVVDTDFTPSRKLSLQDADDMPTLDRSLILVKSRIFSMGETVEFTHDWGPEGGKVGYEIDLNNYILEDYSKVESNPDLILAELEGKPDAISFYPKRKDIRNIAIQTSTGKELLFDCLNGHSDKYVLGLTMEQNTKNQELIARNLRLKVESGYDKVTNFSSFTTREMMDIRKAVKIADPVFLGTCEISHPHIPELQTTINIVGMRDFFYPEEI